MSRLGTERDAAERLGVSVRTLQKWRLQGDGPRFVKLGHAVRYDGQDLEAYIESSRRRSTSESPPESRRPSARGPSGR
jgi:excisionase family DNA binding protein